MLQCLFTPGMAPKVPFMKRAIMRFIIESYNQNYKKDKDTKLEPNHLIYYLVIRHVVFASTVDSGILIHIKKNRF